MSSWRAARDRRLARAVPNGPSGHSWVGTAPLGRLVPIPSYGMSVVYVLYDALGEPIYLGSTEYFQVRLETHLREGKPVASWMAYPCPNRAAAYELEDHLLATHKLPLNVKGPRGRKVAAGRMEATS